MIGNSTIFGEYDSYEEAENKITNLEANDKLDDCFEDNSYEIVEE
jgi:hypothetical protein